ncbi:ABC transporter ATP-binding protein [Salinibacterium sp. ZJ70]|uniref:ABC transporter ATP-binding protein n=1 Tax=Salinibacterium sp. ZJ70 TaxID=2708084 RepID=UPI0014249F61|nr:oligopeptide/dipeptide ABC transporter ATP-binding protein [Salinibacterium sp. ZJ70]
MTGAEAPLLRIEDLVVEYGSLRAVAGVSFDVARGETLGIVGESGCGKSSMGRAIVQMPPPTEGSVVFGGEDLTTMSSRELRRKRLDLQMVFQDPRSSLHPQRTVLDIVEEPLRIWRVGTRESRREVVEETLRAVGLDPEVHGPRRPGALSGGQCQRVAIARALVAGAKVLVCDEPISSLDVSLRATVLNLLEELKAQRDLTVIFIAHDLAVVRNVSDRIMVMYLGTVVEVAESAELFLSPRHPYTRALIASVPTVGEPAPAPLAGDPPSPHDVPTGCRFRTRCPIAVDRCARETPRLRDVGDGHLAACHFADAAAPAGAITG